MAENYSMIESIGMVVKNALSNLHTATVAKVTRVDEKTINCKPVINRYVNGSDVKLPEFIEVPPIFMSGGTSYTAHPISAGDYCLLIFTERCYDRWYEGQDFVQPAEYRMHDYSDGFAIVGLFPRSEALTIPNVITQIGDTYQEGNYEHVGNREQTGDYDLDGNQTTTGTLEIDGAVTLNLTLSVSGLATLGAVSFSSISSSGQSGVTGTFEQDGGGTITVTNGIITGIS